MSRKPSLKRRSGATEDPLSAPAPPFEQFKRQVVSNGGAGGDEPAPAPLTAVVKAADAPASGTPAAPSPSSPHYSILIASEEAKWFDELFQREKLEAAVAKSSSSPTEVSALLAAIARNLLTTSVLVIDGKPYYLDELEAYVRTKNRVHPDPFTHGDARQHLFAKFYFHRMGSGYKGGTYKVVICAYSLSISLAANAVAFVVAHRPTVWLCCPWCCGVHRAWTLRLATRTLQRAS